MHALKKLSVIAGGVVFASLVGRADSKWNNPAGGDWGVAGNWDNGGVPSAAAAEITGLTGTAAATISSAVPDITKVTIREGNKILITNGGSLKATASGDFDVSNGSLEMTGGTLALPNQQIYSTYAKPAVGVSLSGSAVVTAKNFKFNSGTVTLAGSSSLSFSAAYEQAGNSLATVNLCDQATLKVSGMFALGSSYWEPTSNKSVLNIAGGKLTCSNEATLGYGGGTTEVNMSGGSFVGGDYYLSIGSYNSDNVSSKKRDVKATLNLTGGEFEVRCENSKWSSAQNYLTGLSVGNGSRISTYYAEAGRSCLGVLNISGENTKLKVGHAFFTVGVGRATGRVVQNGGSVSTGNGMTTSDWKAQEPMMIGQGGGDGSYVLSNGTLTVGQVLYVGGVKTNAFCRTRLWGYPSDADVGGKAKGYLEIAGGKLVMPSGDTGCIVGADGTGVLRVAAPGIFSTAGHLILSNNVSSTLQIVLGSTSAPTVQAAVLEVSSGAKLEVDVSKYAGSDRWIELVKRDDERYALTRIGDFADSDINIVGNDGSWEVVQHRTGDKKNMLWLHHRKGLVLVVR